MFGNLFEYMDTGGIPANVVTAIASSRSNGKEISYGDDEILKVHSLDGFDFEGTDLEGINGSIYKVSDWFSGTINLAALSIQNITQKKRIKKKRLQL